MFRRMHSSSRTRTWVFRVLLLIVLIRLGFFTFSRTVTNQKKADIAKADIAKAASSTPSPPPSLSPPPLPPSPPPPIPTEARLENVLVQNNQPLRQPNTYIPIQHDSEARNLNLIAPTADRIAMRLKNKKLEYGTGLVWEIGVINTRPDTLVASEKHYSVLNEHYKREYRIYSLMKWILRVHRRDPNRKTPLTMIDAGSNHGLFSLVAAASGARVVAFEPQPNLRSSIGLNARLNNVANRIRVLPFAILNKYRKLSMSQYEKGDGGIGQLDFASKDTITNTQTIRLDDIPSFDLLFHDDNNHKTLINHPNEISANYDNSLEACNAGTQTTIDEALTLRHPIHFLKIDVEGFELRALESASKLFELGLIENLILEFGPPNRWERTVDTSDITSGQKRTATTIHARYLMHRALNEWNMDIYLLPAFGWGKTVQWMYNRNIDYRENSTFSLTNSSVPTPNQRRVVHHLKYWDFDGMPMENDEFELEMRGKKQLVTEVIPLREGEVDDYMSDLESIGEIYVWFAKRDSNQNVLKKLEL